jgi:anti-anti-sigma regulatory factor
MEPIELKEDESGRTQLDMRSVMDASSVHELHDVLKHALEDHKPLVINAEPIERITTPVIQILASAKLSFEQANVKIVLKAPSDAFVAAFDDLGLFPILMRWETEL